MIGSHRRGRHDHLGAVRTQNVHFVLGHLVGADEDATVTLALSDEREADTGVAGRRLDDGATGLELARGLCGLDHLEGDAVLDRASGVEVLDLREDGAFDARLTCYRAELDERGVAHKVGDVL